MPGTYTFPGIYIEEVPSGVHAIAGVSTAETAFVDFFPRGPVDRAERLTSFGDFERIYGGLHALSEASYAIQQYYLNGGQIAWVVRIGVEDADFATADLTTGSPATATLTVSAANPGAWGNGLQVAVVEGVQSDTFDLFVREVVTDGNTTRTVTAEEYRGLTMTVGGRRYAVSVVNEASALVTLADVGLGGLPTGVLATPSGGAPDDAFQPLTNGTDGTAFSDDGSVADPSAFADLLIGDENTKTGMHALDRIEPFIFNLLCLPATANLGDAGATVLTAAIAYCEERRAFLLVDIPPDVGSVDDMVAFVGGTLRDRNAAVYFPRVRIPDPMNDGRPRDAGPSGTMAGVFARIDASRGVWKAPAGTEATLRGVTLAVRLSDRENGALNPLGVNVLRNLPIFGNICWGARTLDGADQQASEWKYIPVRRMAMYIEESLFQGLKWVVFEPNDEPLWAQIRLNVNAFMQTLFRQGAFQGGTPREAYFVKCDKETTTQADIDRGVVNIVVGFAPLKPAEFVVIRIQQMAGQTQA